MQAKYGLNKILIIIFSAAILISAVVIVIALLAEPEIPEPVTVVKEIPVLVPAPAADPPSIQPPSSPGLTYVRTPAQAEPTRPDGFPDPEENWIKLPEGPNLALGKTVLSGENTEVYVAANVVDGELTSYWESRGVPAEITIDLAAVYNIQTVAVRLNPAPIWEPRNQTFEILISTDGSSFTVVSPMERHDFDPDSGNIVRIDFPPAEARYVKLDFSAKSSGRSAGAQAAEIEIYE